MSSLHLSTAELDAIIAAAQPIARDRREAFKNAVMEALRECGELGPGVVHRAIVATQREFYDPPLEHTHGGKYR
jgi:hypothetical protein